MKEMDWTASRWMHRLTPVTLSFLITGIFATTFFVSGCATSPRRQAHQPITIEGKGVAFLEDATLAMTASSPSTWDVIIEATGKGLPAPHAPTDIQKKFTALEAAKYRAIAELAEKVRGMRVTRTGEVRDMAFAGEKIAIEMSGQIEGVHIVRQTYDEATGLAEVTVRVGMDNNGNLVSQGASRLTPLSLPERMARAEEAARMRAAAAVREQIGEIRVEETIEVRNLIMVQHHARQHVEGILENVRFSKPEWVSRNQCEVVARVELSSEDLQRLSAFVADDSR